MKIKLQHLLMTLTMLAGWQQAVADSPTSISYQGLVVGTPPLTNTTYLNMTFTLFDTNSGGIPLAGPITNTAVTVNSNGLFSTTMDFGSNVFAGGSYYLEIGARTNGDPGPFTTLSPRQLLGSTPQSVYALNAGTANTALSAATATNFVGTVEGDVTGAQGAMVVSSVGGQTATNIALGVIAANNANSAGTPNTIVALDGTGSFSAGSVTLDGVLNLPFPAEMYTGTNMFLVEEGNLYIGLGHGPANPGLHNDGFGDYTLFADSSINSLTGNYNTAIGEYSLENNTSGAENTAGGYGALQHNTTGNYNKADGYEALYSNTSGTANTAEGGQALYFNTTGNYNTANGLWALFNNSTGSGNDSIGYHSMYYNSIGSGNTANGTHALSNNGTGSNNVAVGYYALQNSSFSSSNTAVGAQALANVGSGMNDIALGYEAGSSLAGSESGNIDIGNLGQASENNTIRVGVQGTQTATYVAGIWQNSLASNALAVVVDSTGHLGVGTGNGSGGVNSVVGTSPINAVTSGGTATVSCNSSSVGVGFPNYLVQFDGNGSFEANNIALGSTVNAPNQTGVLNLPETTSTAGMITLGGVGNRFLHGFGTNNFFGGLGAGNFTMTGGFNVGVGAATLQVNTSGSYNTAVGWNALLANTDGADNTANGREALVSNLTGNLNTAVGVWSLREHTNGDSSTAIGYDALTNDRNGTGNLAVGSHALYTHTSSTNNVALGPYSLDSLTSGTNNIGVGNLAGDGLTSGNNNIYVGNNGPVSAENNTIRIGTYNNPTVGSNIVDNTYIAGIYGVPLVSSLPVYVDSTGHMGTLPSSERYKEDIADMGDESDALLGLRPVTFHYKSDATHTPQFGLIAEEVDKLDSRLVVRDAQNQIAGVRYEAVNAMLLNEFLKEHEKVEAQAQAISTLESRLSSLEQAVQSFNAGK